MPRIETPVGPAFHPGTEEEAAEAEKILWARHRFIAAYCESKGWPTDPGELSIDQILEIREQAGWKDPK